MARWTRLGTIPGEGMERGGMVAWARGGAPMATAERESMGFLVSIKNVVREKGLTALASELWSAAIPLALVVVMCPAHSSWLLQPHSWSYAMRHELLHLFAATWMRNSRTHPVSKCCPSQGAAWNNTLHFCPTFIAGAEDVLEPAPSSWPGVMQGSRAGQHHRGDWGRLCVFTHFYSVLILWWPSGLQKSLSTRVILVTPLFPVAWNKGKVTGRIPHLNAASKTFEGSRKTTV